MTIEPKDATAHTRAALRGAVVAMDPADFERASRGLIATHPTGVIDGPAGPAWDLTQYDFIGVDTESPPTVHPSLWRQAQLNNIHGLFEVGPGIWQARGYDISNVTFIEGATGWIVIDPLTTEYTARACLALANEHLGNRPVTAVIYTHSHADHFGGVRGVTSDADVAAGNVRIIAGEGFLRETVSENVIAGPAMARRAQYQFGPLLPVSATGHVDCGLGKAMVKAQPGLMAPTEDVTHTGQELVVDGVPIIFQLTPEAEAPVEMNFFFPDRGWLCMAENCTHNMHNLVPMRGAQVRNSLAWSKYIGEAREMFGSRTDVLFASHHWPRWGRDDVDGFLRLQRDLYRWMHDQTMRHANHGLTAPEIAETLTLPPEFEAEGHTTGYYGDLVHNVKAVYQRYLSWYDGNPVHLNGHPPTEAAKRYVDFMGGADAVVAKAQASFDAGDYRWVTEVVGHVVFAEPDHVAARQLQADAMEQLGYQACSATVRNSYLTGAQELRQGSPARAAIARRGLIGAVSIDMVFDTLSVRLKADELEAGARAIVNWRFTDIAEDWILGLEHRALHSIAGRHDADADVTVTMTKELLGRILNGEVTFLDAISAGDIVLDGDGAALLTIFGNLDTFETNFAIIEP